MTLPTIAIIGAGHMGESLLSGLIASGHPPQQLFACDVHEERLSALRARFNIRTSIHNRDGIANASIVLFAVKPQQIKQVMLAERDLLIANQPLIISIAAGVPTKAIQSWLSNEIAIVRAMPNMPALIQTGVTALFATEHVSQEGCSLAESVLRAVGITVWMTNEELMDTVTALSGSGPAYFFYMMDALQQSGIALGLSPQEAKLLTIQTALGAARMALESDASLQTLCDQVTSKGGTTEAALQVFETAALRSIFKEAVMAARDRSCALAKMIEGVS